MATPVRRPNCGAATPRPIDRVDLEQQLGGRNEAAREQSVQLARIAAPTRGLGEIRRHDRGEREVGDDVDHLPAVSPGIVDTVPARAGDEPAVAIGVTGVARARPWRP